jgi:hypothetical protein
MRRDIMKIIRPESLVNVAEYAVSHFIPVETFAIYCHKTRFESITNAEADATKDRYWTDQYEKAHGI